MDTSKKKEIIYEYKNRKSDMGIISLKCKETGESFLGASKDINADFNSVTFKLDSGFFPNRRLLELWKKYGRDGFEFSVLEHVECKDPTEDYTDKLEQLREKYLGSVDKSMKIWK